jgi:hypothetical protein
MFLCLILSYYFMKYLYSFRLLTFLIAALSPWPMLAQGARFTFGNIVVARVGDGSAPLSNAATEVFLDEYTPSGMLVQSINLPTSLSGKNRILTASGNVSSELGMTRSADGRYLVLTGYSAATGTPAVASSSSTDITRVIGLIAADGSFDTSTSTGSAAFSTTSICAAATADGTSFYSVGGNSGVQYQALGSPRATQLTTVPASIRTINIANGNLYVSTGTSSYVGLSQVSTGLPTSVGQAATLLPGFPASTGSASPYGFYFADLSATVPGVDVVYVADDRITAGGIQKWSLVAGSWVLNGTIAGSTSSVIRGLNGTTNGASVSLVASSSNDLFVLDDEAGYNAAPNLTDMPEAIATAGENTAFRGIAFAPVAPVPAIASFTPTSGLVGTTITLTGTNFTGATSVALNGVAVANFTVVDAATITVVVPVGVTSGLIKVTTQGGTTTSTNAFTVLEPNPAPTIGSLAPATAVAGSGSFPLTVNGTGFVNGAEILFNGAILPTTLVSPTQLTATVPPNAVTTAGIYAVTVTNPTPGGGPSTTSPFTVLVPAPTISSFTPTTGGPGTLVTITGTGFMGATAVRIGSFTIANYTVVSASTITLAIPSGLGNVNGFLMVDTPSGTATSALTFNLVLATLASQVLPGLTVFPNPATDYISVELPQSGNATVALRDLTGRLVLAPVALAAHQPLRLPAYLAAGIYLLEVRQGSVTAMRRVEIK